MGQERRERAAKVEEVKGLLAYNLLMKNKLRPPRLRGLPLGRGTGPIILSGLPGIGKREVFWRVKDPLYLPLDYFPVKDPFRFIKKYRVTYGINTFVIDGILCDHRLLNILDYGERFPLYGLYFLTPMKCDSPFASTVYPLTFHEYLYYYWGIVAPTFSPKDLTNQDLLMEYAVQFEPFFHHYLWEGMLPYRENESEWLISILNKIPDYPRSDIYFLLKLVATLPPEKRTYNHLASALNVSPKKVKKMLNTLERFYLIHKIEEVEGEKSPLWVVDLSVAHHFKDDITEEFVLSTLIYNNYPLWVLPPKKKKQYLLPDDVILTLGELPLSLRRALRWPNIRKPIFPATLDDYHIPLIAVGLLAPWNREY